MSEEKQKVSPKNQFTSFFNARVLRLTQAIEKKRKELLLLCIVIPIVGVPVSLLTILLAPWAVPLSLYLLVLLPVFSIRESYACEAKSKILPAILSFWGKYKYIPKRPGMGLCIFRALKAKTPFKETLKEYCKPRYPKDFNFNALARMYAFSDFNIDDCIAGNFNSLKMQVNEIELFRYKRVHAKEGDKKRKETLFKGIVLAAEINKPFEGVTAVSKFGLDERILTAPGDIDISESGFEKMTEFLNKTPEEIEELKKKAKDNPDFNYWDDKTATAEPKIVGKCSRVVLEDVEFEKKFKTYSTDQIEARYILTTAFMERFKQAAARHRNNVEALFYNQTVYILIHSNKNWFEIPFFKSANDINNYKSIIAEFSSLLAVLDTLKLEQNIGM